MQSLPMPWDRTYWVRPGLLLAGCYPGSQIQREMEGKLSSLLDSGILSIINLMEENETGHSGEPFTPYEAVFKKLGIERGIDVLVQRFPIKDYSIPDNDLMRKIIDSIDNSINNDMPVFVHCWGGRGRTGTVVGCYLARHGIAHGNKVLEMINSLRKNEPTGHLTSPETEEQRRFIIEWREGN